MKVWDVRKNRSVRTLAAHTNEVLSCDWDKYSNHFVTASVDQSLAVWDPRQLQTPLYVLTGHTFAIRRVKYSPHQSSVLASASYDMTVCLWDTSAGMTPVKRFPHHSEFAIGVDFCLFQER